MDKKLTDSEIVKALECCVRFKQICPETCPMVNVRQCKVDLRKNTLALINRQKAEIERLKEEYNRLLNSELQQYENGCGTYTVEGGEYVADYLLANGVIVPPCKVGDKVFVVSQGQGLCMRWNVYEGKVVDIHLNRHNKLTIRVENGEKFFGYYEPCFIFLTKEEAEQALKECNNR